MRGCSLDIATREGRQHVLPLHHIVQRRLQDSFAGPWSQRLHAHAHALINGCMQASYSVQKHDCMSSMPYRPACQFNILSYHQRWVMLPQEKKAALIHAHFPQHVFVKERQSTCSGSGLGRFRRRIAAVRASEP